MIKGRRWLQCHVSRHDVLVLAGVFGRTVSHVCYRLLTVGPTVANAKRPNLKFMGFEVLDLIEKDMGIGPRHRLGLIGLQSTCRVGIGLRASMMEELLQQKWAHKQKKKLVIVQAKRVFIVKSFF